MTKKMTFKQIKALCFIFMILLMGISKSNAQTITTTFLNNNGSSVVVFSITNSSPTASYIITGIGSQAGFTGTGTARLYAKTATYNVAPGAVGAVTAANGWTDIGSNTALTTTSNTTGTGSTAPTWISGMTYQIPPLTQVRFCLQHVTAAGAASFSTAAGSIRYSTVGTQTCSFANGDLTLNGCTSYAYGGTMASPTNAPRGLVGFINYSSAAPCTGTPAPGNTLTSAASLCAGGSASLSLQNNTSGTGVTYQWYSSPDDITYTAITGATSSTYTASVINYYKCDVTCSGSTTTSNSVQLVANSFFNCYCASAATSTADEDISNVTFGTLNNSSGCATLAPGPGSVVSMYSNYKSGAGAPTPPSVSQLQSVPFSLTQTSCGGAYGNSFDIYIDYNQNGLFTDAGELVYDGASVNGNHTDVGNILIPLTATVGTTAMRIINVEGGASSPCQSYTWGETEDYLINIVATTACAGTPDPANTMAPTSVCSGANVALSLSTTYTAAGLSFQWQSSPDNITYTNIAGATNVSYTTTQSTATYYQCEIICANGGFPTISTPALVSMNAPLSCYCTPPQSTNYLCCSMYVNNVTTTGGIANFSQASTEGTASYQNYSATQIASQVQGGSLTIATTTNTYGMYMKVWIDYNDDGLFTGTGEQVLGDASPAGLYGGTAPATFTQSFTVPAAAPPGTHRMRLRAEYYGMGTTTPANPCSILAYGETEDYGFTVLAPPATPGAITEQASPNCATGGFLDVTGSAPSGETWYWQSTATGTSTASPVSGSYTILANGTYYVRGQNDTYLNWGASSSITVTDFPSGPADPIISAPTGNPACGAVTLVSSTAAAFSSNYWQGTNATGTSTATLADDGSTNNPFAAPADGTYYLRAQDGSTFCWSNPVPVVVTIYPLPTAPILAATPSVVCPGTPSALSAIAPSAPATGYTASSIAFAPTAPAGPTNPGPVGDDVVSASIPLGFGFSYYGTTYTNLVISTNGFVSFDAAPGAGCCSGQSIPSTIAPNNLIAACWTDLNTGSGGNIDYYNLTSPNRFVIRYNGVAHFSTATIQVTSQIVIYESGIIEIHNTNILPDGIMTQGIEGPGGVAATPVSGRNAGTWSASNDAYRFSPTQAMGFLWTPNGPANGLAAGQEILANATATPPATTTYTMTLTDPAHGCQSSGTVTLTTLTTPPAPTTTGGSTPCGSGTVTLSATTSGGTLNWYDVPTGGTSIATGTSFTTPILNANTTYYVEETNGTCSGPRSPALATYTVADAVTITAVNGAVCNPGGLDATLTASSANTFYNYTWSPAPLSTSGSNGEVAIVHPSVTTTYTVTGFDGSCTAQATVTVTVTNTPVIGSVTATPATICQGGISQLVALVGGSGSGAAPTNYCTPTVSVAGATGDFVNNFSFNTLANNGSGDNPADYALYAQTTTVSAGSTYALSAQSGPTFGQGIGVWIDYNRNGSFTDAGEFVFGSTSSTATVTSNITIPAGASAGQTRIRVYAHYATTAVSTESCGHSSFGEYEDYIITVNAASLSTVYAWTGGTFSNPAIYNPTVTLGAASETYTVSATDGGCTATATVTLAEPVSAPGNTLSTANPVCGGASFTLSVQTPGVGAAFQWQSSPDGFTWTDIVGATNATYAASQNADTYYRSGVGCALNLVYSNAIFVTMACNAISGGTTVSSNANPCAGASFTLSLSGNTSVCVSYQWQWSVDGITYSDILGATASTLTTSQGIPYYYQCVISCTGGASTGTSSPLYVGINTNFFACYCAAGASVIGCTSGDEYVGNFTFNTINNTSACPATGQYSDFTGISTTVNLGSSYTASVLIPNWFSGDQATVWIDFNHNGSYYDAGESFPLTTGGGTGTSPLTGSITIPATALTGTTGLRVRGNYSGAMDPCGITTFGEVEDYLVNIVNPTASLSLVCYIQGYYLGSGLMTPTIQNEDSDPITPPNYLATDCDNITVELHQDDAVNGYPLVGTYTGMLHTDGTISCSFPGTTVGLSCYIVILHRNSLQTWSKLPMTIAATNTYNFSTAATQALGDNEIDVASDGVYSIYNGDINQDFATDATDFLIMDMDIQSFNGGYITTDLNGDGATDATDFLILDGNIQGFIGAVILP